MRIFDIFKKSSSAKTSGIPIPRERISSEDVVTYSKLLSAVNARLDIVDPRIPTNFLDIIEKLCIANPDFSQTLKNMINQSNTGHEITIDAPNESTINKAVDRLNKLAARINTDDLVNKLLRQIGITGALSLEWVAMSDLSGIDKVVLVPVKSIRFQYDNKEDSYKPTQYVQQTNKYIELNETTYTYSAIETAEGSPYAIPLFLSALGNAVIQIFMMDSLKFVIKKIGLLGLVDVVLQSPAQAPGESQEDYTKRVASYLNEFASNFSQNYRDGVIAHLDNMEISHSNIAGDARGAKEILQMNEEQVISGLNTVPALLGRTYSTTETYAGVLYSLYLKSISNYQRAIKRAIEKGYKLDLYMAGILVDDVSAHFNPNDALNPKEDAEAEAVRTDTAITKMDAGIISPDDAARELGYDEAYGDDFEVDEGKLSARLNFSNGRYSIKNIGVPAILSRKKRTPRDPEGIIERRRLRWADKYNSDVLQVNGKAINGSVNDVKNYLNGLLGLDPDTFAESVYDLVASMHPVRLKDYNLEKAVVTDVLAIYRYYRVRDKLIEKKRIPIKFTMPDKRAIHFLNSLDDFHISKFITNKPARSRMLKFLKTEHLEGRTAEVEPFIKAFKKELGDLSKAQVRNIVDTSVTRIRSWGHIRQLSEMRAAKAVVSEVMDSITCSICREMHGKEFRVDSADYKISELSNLSPEEFQRQVYDEAPEDWKSDPTAYAHTHSMEDFIDNNMVGPPFHGHCRGRLVVK